MMPVMLLSLMILVIPYIVATGSKHTVKTLYKPCTPKMCREMCLASTDVFNYIREDSSCRRIDANSSGYSDNPEDSRTFQKHEKGFKGTASVDGRSGQKSCDQNSIDGGSCSVAEKLATKPIATRENKLPQCKPVNNLHKACMRGKVGTVRTILSRGLEDINCRDHSGRTPVMTSARHGRGTVFKYLVAVGCDLSVVDVNSNTVLHLACAGGNTDIVRRLLHNKTYSVDIRGSLGQTPLMLAAFYGHKEVMELLISQGSNLTVVTQYDNDNTLHWACRGGHVNAVKYVLSRGIIDINSRGRFGLTPAMSAAYRGHRNVFDFLMSRGCDLRAVDYSNNNIFHVVCQRGHVEMAKYILSLNKYGLDIRGMIGRTPVMIAVRHARKEVVQLLVRKGCNMNAKDDDGNTVIHIACIGGDRDMLEYLIKLGVEGFNQRNKQGQTPLQVAKSKGKEAIVAFLKNGIQNG